MSTPDKDSPLIFVVEDEAALRELIAESLEAQGFAVAQAGDATDAQERLAGFAYDALVVDLRLPDADGMEVLDAALADRFQQLVPAGDERACFRWSRIGVGFGRLLGERDCAIAGCLGPAEKPAAVRMGSEQTLHSLA